MSPNDEKEREIIRVCVAVHILNGLVTAAQVDTGDIAINTRVAFLYADEIMKYLPKE